MGDYLKPIMHSLQGNLRSDVRFSALWYLFKPSQSVYVKDKDISQKVWRVVQTTGERRCLSSRSASDKSEAASKQPRDPRHTDFVPDCYYIDYDGARYGSSLSEFHISKFDVARAIDALPLYPFSVAERDGMVDSEKLAKRGREFIRCTQSCHLHYSGRSQIRQPYGDYLSHQSNNDSGRVSRVFSKNIYSEVMIDLDRALQQNPEWLPEFFDFDPHKLDPQQMDAREVEEDAIQEGRFFERMEYDWRWDMRVAHSNQKPLLPITCGKISLQVVSNCAKCSKGDLRVTPKEVESKLESHFQLAQAWDCVLLLDEADVFLAQRNNTDLRNALLSGIPVLSKLSHSEYQLTLCLTSLPRGVGVLRRYPLPHNK